MKAIYSIRRIWLASVILLAIYGSWLSLYYAPHFWGSFLKDKLQYQAAQYSISGLLFFGWYGLISTIINQVTVSLSTRYQQNILWGVARALKIIVALLLINEACVLFDISPTWQTLVWKSTRVISLVSVGIAIFRLIQNSDTILLQYTPNVEDSIHARSQHTYITVIKRIALLFWAMLVASAILMTFEQIRSAGTAILASAGVSATVVLFSARSLLENIFKGLQVAVSQPIRKEDIITIDGDTGTVSDITLQHVVVTLSDRSQLIIPISRLLEGTFKNWTHSSNDLIGDIIFYVHNTMPIALIREKFHDIVKANKYWDKSVAEVGINGIQGATVALRFIMSAKSGKDLSALRDDVQEQMLEYMQQHHPKGLPL